MDQNLLSVGQLVEKEFKVFFKNWYYHFYDATGNEILRGKMRGKSFLFNPTETAMTSVPQKSIDCHLQRILRMKMEM